MATDRFEVVEVTDRVTFRKMGSSPTTTLQTDVYGSLEANGMPLNAAAAMFGVYGRVNQTVPYDFATSTLQLTTGTLYGSAFVAQTEVSVAAIQIAFSTAGVGGSLFRAGLYTVASDGTMTLVARTSGAFADCTTTGLVSLPFNTGGGYPASYSMTQGTVYAIAMLSVGASTNYGVKYHNLAVAPGVSQTVYRVKRALTVSGQTDCPTSISSSATWGTVLPWAAAA